jgi:regulatory protein
MSRSRQPRRLNAAELHHYAVQALARRARSTAEMRRLLERRATDPADIEGVLARLSEYGFLNDERFAQIYASSRLENNRLGRSRVERDLRAHLVAPKLAKKAVTEIYDEIDEPALLREHIARRLRHRGPPKDRRGAASLYRHLLGAGFSPAHIIPELRRLSKGDTAWLEEVEAE